MRNINTMKILLCEEPTKLIYQQRELPSPKDNEALIKVLNVGICGTDIHAWAGNQPFFSYPRVLGHEICGEIIKLGSNVHNINAGQRVAVIPYVACHHCNSCLSGKQIAARIFQLSASIRMGDLVSIYVSQPAIY